MRGSPRDPSVLKGVSGPGWPPPQVGVDIPVGGRLGLDSVSTPEMLVVIAPAADPCLSSIVTILSYSSWLEGAMAVTIKRPRGDPPDLL